MYLSKLEIFGFKSFAQKTVFKFEEGLTAIIGPNGCGKSNIVDAIRWVLGEQRPSVLRCDRMENLIFNGTAKRKPLNFTEVSLYIENNKKILPSEYTEIKITRRLYRSGESEYLINNQKVRLLDIINLFADTGMGADAYSVIELKMVEEILSENADERRRLFEEAAGIKKYKMRRKSALRKLETTRQELTRLNDIIAEVQKTVNSLARQVGKARRYHAYKEQIKEKEVLLARMKIQAYETDLLPLREEKEQVERTREKLVNELRVQEAEMEEKEARAAKLEHQYREIANRLHAEDESIRELRSQVQLRKQKIESLTESLQQLDQELQALQQQREKLQQQEQDLHQQFTETSAQLAQLQEAYRDVANALLDAEMAYQNDRLAYQNFVQENLQQLRENDTLKEKYQEITAEKKSLRQRLERLEEQRQQLRQQRNEKEPQLQELETEQRALEEEQSLYQQELERIQKRLEENRQQLEQRQHQLLVQEGQLEKLKSQRDFLEKLIQNYEGFSETVQYIMSRRKNFRGLIDTLANLVESPPEYQVAVESYLSEVADYILVEQLDTARQILQHIRKTNKGRLTLIPLPLLNTNNHRLNGKLPPVNGPSRPLKDVVTYRPEYQSLFDYLFEGVYLVPDMELALQYHEKYPDCTYVTRDGEIIGQWGNITVGGRNNGVSLIGRKRQYQQVLRELKDLSARMEEAQNKIARHQEEQERLQQKEQEFRELLKSVASRLIAVEKRLGQVRYEWKRQQELETQLQEEIDTLQARLHDLEAEENRLQPRIQQYEQTVQRYQLEEARFRDQQQSSEARYKSLQEQNRKLQIDILNLTARENEIRQQIQFVRQQQEEARQRETQNQQARQEKEKQIQELKQEIDAIESQLSERYVHRDEVEQQKNQIEQQFHELRSEIQIQEEAYKKKNRLLHQAQERIQKLEMRIQELELRMESQREQLREKHGVDLADFSRQELPSQPIPEIQEEIDRLRQRLENLGEVNPLAIKEHEKEKERLEFLKAQQADLLDAENQLLETIGKLNQTAQSQFMETFEKIRTNFRKVFREFFENGEADLYLVENRDPLESNIEFSIKIKGRRLNTLSLLSAGEKTLTAISLLFAIYLVKPSPFCILDEVDAPLDDVNISRFSHALKQFAHNTQFILVTHNKRTMEAAQTMYGVTMEEPGVSKVVSVRLD
ncbi:MAG: chromosome segregation protein SMC [Calditrichaeota bacterium]|nr:chromosome segregation protein SMC [Calditrichota bacterium]